MKVTFESTESVGQVVAVLAALYQMPITVTPVAGQPEVAASTAAPVRKNAPGTTAPPKLATAVTARRPRRTAQVTPAPVDAAAVRVWARDQGITVNARGALPATVLTAYRAAAG